MNRERQEAKLVRRIDEARRRDAARDNAAVERERQMLKEMATMRHLAELGEKRERAAEARAQKSEARERFMVKLTGAGVAFGGLGFAAAVVAIIAA